MFPVFDMPTHTLRHCRITLWKTAKSPSVRLPNTPRRVANACLASPRAANDRAGSAEQGGRVADLRTPATQELGATVVSAGWNSLLGRMRVTNGLPSRSWCASLVAWASSRSASSPTNTAGRRELRLPGVWGAFQDVKALGVLQLGSGVLSHSAVTERAASTRKALARPLVSVFRGLGLSETRSQRRSVRLTASRGASKTLQRYSAVSPVALNLCRAWPLGRGVLLTRQRERGKVVESLPCRAWPTALERRLAGVWDAIQDVPGGHQKHPLWRNRGCRVLEASRASH